MIQKIKEWLKNKPQFKPITYINIPYAGQVISSVIRLRDGRVFELGDDSIITILGFARIENFESDFINVTVLLDSNKILKFQIDEILNLKTRIHESFKD